jgi:hypothetical protein
LKNIEAAQIRGASFSAVNFVYSFCQYVNGFWAKFWAIYSQTRLVTLFAASNN